MQKHSIVALTLVIFTLAIVTTAMAAEPNVGTWKLNLAKSKYSPGPPPKSQTQKIQAQENGIKYAMDGVDGDGKVIHAEYAAKYDGRDYPYLGTPDVDTIALTRVDENTVAWVVKKNGKEVESGRSVVSKDGKTRTVTAKGKDTQGKDTSRTSVYDKQ